MNEYISREAAIKALEWKWAGKAAIDAVKFIPTANVVEVRHSCWVEDGLSLVCKSCGWMQYHDLPYGYCPNCGAKMDGGIGGVDYAG